MLKKIVFLGVLFFPWLVVADPCIEYKINPEINLKNPSWNKTVILSKEWENKLHGHVTATMIDDYDIVVDIVPLMGGYCVYLKNVDCSIGYNEFDVKIDAGHIPGSCSYNAVLSHEDKHIQAYLSVITDLDKELYNSVFDAANSIMPVFVEKKEDIDTVVENMNYEIQKHPELVLIKQKINAAQEIRNKRVDQNEDNSKLRACFGG